MSSRQLPSILAIDGALRQAFQRAIIKYLVNHCGGFQRNNLPDHYNLAPERCCRRPFANVITIAYKQPISSECFGNVGFWDRHLVLKANVHA